MATYNLPRAVKDVETVANVSLRKNIRNMSEFAGNCLKTDTQIAMDNPLEDYPSITLEGKQPIPSTQDEADIEKTANMANKEEPPLVPKGLDDKPAEVLKRCIRPMVPERNYERDYFDQETYIDELAKHDEARTSNAMPSNQLRTLTGDHETEVSAWKDRHAKLVCTIVELNNKLLRR